MRQTVLLCLAMALILAPLAAQAEGIGTFSAGYQHRSEGGFFVRPTMNMLYKDGGFVLIPGIALGGSF